MYIEERHQAIFDWLSEKGSISNADIQENFGVSYDSAKRDIRPELHGQYCNPGVFFCKY